MDLLPPAYLSSLKRTESRVRFADSHAGPSGSTSMLGLSSMNDPIRHPPPRRRSSKTVLDLGSEGEVRVLRQRKSEKPLAKAQRNGNCRR